MINTLPAREAWLIAATDALRPLFQSAGHPIPDKIHLSVGFPRSRKAIGQHWCGDNSADGCSHVFICPTHESDFDMLDTLAHELAHAAAPPDSGHGRNFIKVCKAVGLEKDPTWKHAAAGEELKAILLDILQAIGPSSHATLTEPVKERKKQSTRLRLYECECQPPIKLRVAKDDLAAHCDLCESPFCCKTAA